MKKIFGRLSKKKDKEKGPPDSPKLSPAAQGHGVGYEVREKELPKLHKAAWIGDLGKVKQLIKKDASPLDKENRTPLHLACVRGHNQVVQEMLEWNAKTNIGDNEAKTPLMKAVECSQEECVRLLVEYRADVDAVDRNRESGLHYAVKYDFKNIAEILIKAGANVDLKNKVGQAPLLIAILGKKDEMARLLLKYNADVNIVDNSNLKTPLMYACQDGLLNQVKLLLEFNADTTLKDSKGWTAEDCATVQAHHACSQLVYDHNLKLRRSAGHTSSIASTPRSAVPGSNATTPRDKTDSDFGAPAVDIDHDDSGDETLSHPLPGDRTSDASWADDSESIAVDQKKPDESSDFEGELEDEEPGGPSLLKALPKSDSEGEATAGQGQSRVVVTRTPSPSSPGLSLSPSPKPGSKIPPMQSSIRSQSSRTSAEDNWTDDDAEDIDEAPGKGMSRVSFKEEQEFRDITSDDETADGEDEEEEEVKAKRPRLDSDDDRDVSSPSLGYTPTSVGAPQTSKTAMTPEKQKALLQELGIEDDVDDVSDPTFSDTDPLASPRPQKPDKEGEVEITPRPGILKNWKSSSEENKPHLQKQEAQESEEPPSFWDSDDDDVNVRRAPKESKLLVEAEINPLADFDLQTAEANISKEESEWDSKAESSSKLDVIHVDGDVSPEYDSDLENSLKPDEPPESSYKGTSQVLITKDPDGSSVELPTSSGPHVASGSTADPESELNKEMEEIEEGRKRDSETAAEKGQQTSGSASIEVRELSDTIEFVEGIKIDPRPSESDVEETDVDKPGPCNRLIGESPQIVVSSPVGEDDGNETDSICVNPYGNSPYTDASSETPYPEGESPYPEGESPYPEGESPYPGGSPYPEGESPYPGRSPYPEGESPYPGQSPYPVGESPFQEASSTFPEGSPSYAMAEGNISDADQSLGADEHVRKEEEEPLSNQIQVLDPKAAPQVLFSYQPSTDDMCSDLETLPSEMFDDDSVHGNEADMEDEDVEVTPRQEEMETIIRPTTPKVGSSENSSAEITKAMTRERKLSDGGRREAAPSDDFMRSTSHSQETVLERTAAGEGEQTSQWDSTPSATPRTPRDQHNIAQYQSPINKISYEEEDDDEDDTAPHHTSQVVQKTLGFEVEDEGEEEDDEVDDQIEEAVTSFGMSSVPSQLVTAGSIVSGPSSSSSKQKTVLEVEVHEGPEEENEVQVKDDDGESDWDSEDDGPPTDRGGSPPVYGPEVTQQVKAVLSAEHSPRVDSSDVSPRVASLDVSPRVVTSASAVSDEETISEWEIERQQLKAQEQTEMWEQEEQKRHEDMEREIQEELEREQMMARSAEDEQSGSDDDDDDFDVDIKLDEPETSLTTVTSARFSPRKTELKKPPKMLEVKNFMPMSPRKEMSKAVQMGEIEDESPIPTMDSPVDVQMHMATTMSAQGRLGMEPLKETSERPSPESSPEQLEEEEEVDFADGQEEELKEEPVVVEEVVPVKARIQKMEAATSPSPAVTKVIPPRKSDLQEEDSYQRHGLREELERLEAESERDRYENYMSGAPPPPQVHTLKSQKNMSRGSDGNSIHDDDSVDELDSPRHRPDVTQPYLPGLYGTTGQYNTLDIGLEDDGLSVTSTENESITYQTASLPYGKDMLVNMNLADSGAVLKLQEHLRDHRRQLEYEKGQRMLLDNEKKMLEREKNELRKRNDVLTEQKSSLEQTKLDLEAKIRNIEYNFNEEQEKRKNAELLLAKTKEHLAKKEEQFTSEMESKQRAELTQRNIQMELRSAQNQIKELEEEKEELQRLLNNEKSARQLQEKINDEQSKLQQQLHQESLRTSSQKDSDSDDAHSRLESADEDRQKAFVDNEKLRSEIIALKSELQRQRTRLTDENAMMAAENEKLQAKIDDLRNEVKLNEEALTTLQVQHNLQLSNTRTEAAMLDNSLEKERGQKEKIETELESVKSRLNATVSELEKAQMARNELERRHHDDREDWARQIERKEHEVNGLKESTQNLLQRLNATETKLNSVENELHVSNTTLLERSNLLTQTQRDLQYYKSAQDNFDQNYRHEKEQTAKLQAKLDSQQDRLTSLQHENLSLKQQLDLAQQAMSDRSGLEISEKISTMLASLKADHEKARLSLEEKNTALNDTVNRMREEVRNSDNRRNTLEQDLRRLNQEYNDLVRKLSVAEASLDMTTKSKESLEQERAQLKIEIERLQTRCQTAQDKSVEAQTRMGELVERLERAEQTTLLSNKQLADTSANLQAFSSTKGELEENFQKVQMEIVRLEAELKHEKQKNEMLERDLQDSQKVRSSLEALCSNLKSTNAHLEDKLGPEHVSDVNATDVTFKHNVSAQEADESKELWEKEVISRSKLGLRIAQLDKQKQEGAAQLEEEKRRVRKALEQKKLAETKLQAEQDKCMQLQKELANLKAYLKVAKKKLRDHNIDDAVDTNENRLHTIHSTFDKERLALEENMVSVKSQLEYMRNKLQNECDEKEKLHEQNLKLQGELGSLKKLEMQLKKLERSKKKLEEEFELYKNQVENGYVDKASVEMAKKELEAQYRAELNRKLDEVNTYLEEQARARNKLDTSRDEQDSEIRKRKRKLEEEVTDLRVRYEQAMAQRETKEMEAKRYRDLYESEMQWRMRLSEQLYKSTDKAFNYKNNAERQKSRAFGSLGNLSFNSPTMNGHGLDLGKLSTGLDDPLSNRLRAELDRSIAKHLEAAPHDNFRPSVRTEDSMITPSSFAKANADYIEVLKRKYCV